MWWLLGYIVGTVVLVALSERQDAVRGGDGWGWAVVYFVMFYPCLWAAVVIYG